MTKIKTAVTGRMNQSKSVVSEVLFNHLHKTQKSVSQFKKDAGLLGLLGKCLS